jgi:hypothetical protein
MILIRNKQSGDTALVHSLDGHGDEWEVLLENAPDDNVLDKRWDDDSKAFVPVTGLYADRRRQEYPPIEDQLDTLYHGGFDAWREKIKAVKDKYPKT